MQFATIFVTLITIVSALPINTEFADVHAASKGNVYAQQLWNLNMKYEKQAEAVDNAAVSPIFKKLSSVVLKCNIASALQTAVNLKLEAGKTSKLQSIQQKYNIDLAKLKSQHKNENIASCNR